MSRIKAVPRKAWEMPAGVVRPRSRRLVRYPCYNFPSPERFYVEADPVISSAGGSIIPRISAIQVL